MHFSFDQLLNFLMALVAAVSAFVAAWKSHQTAKDVRAMEARQLGEIIKQGRPGAADVPAASINDVLRYWDLLTKLVSVWATVKMLPPHTQGFLPIIKAKVNGRHARIGPTPVEFED